MPRPRIIDGGLATGLEQAGVELHPTLWSAGAFVEDPAAVRSLHERYLAAGAEILISASYQMSLDGLRGLGLDRAGAEDAMRRTVGVAREACHAAGRSASVAASIGPYGAARADGSEYRGNYGVSVDELVAFHRHRMAVLGDTDADLLAIETIPSLDETRAVCTAVDAVDTMDAWVSFTCRDDRSLRDGSPIEDAVRIANGSRRITAIGVNCTPPRHVGPLIERIQRATDRRILVYPNSGEDWDAARRRWCGQWDRDEFLDLARGWAARGIWAIGGCCRIGPDSIGALARLLRA